MSKRVDFLSPLSVIPGFGEKRIDALRESGLSTVGDLLYRLPRRHLNRSEVTPIAHLHQYEGTSCTVSGEVTTARVERGRRNRFRVMLKDDSGVMELIWFNSVSYLSKSIRPGVILQATGTPKLYQRFQMAHPEIAIENGEEAGGYPFEPRYSLSDAMRAAKIGQKRLIDAIAWLFKNVTHFPEKLPAPLEKRYRFPSLRDSLYRVHFPEDPRQNDHWMERIKYEELYQTALTLRWIRRDFSLPGTAMHGEELREQFLQTLPFSLTAEQQKAVISLSKESGSPQRMHRLLQGDVGCGKTVTAFIATLPALQSGFQVAWIAPTEVLARQSFKEISAWLEPLGFTPRLMTGSTPVKEKRILLHDLKAGTIPFIVGTHSLLQERVGFNALRMIVVDEQHRFGAQQRLALQQKSPSADLLMMSATPIPQSLAATVYSDLNLLTIKALPNGRKPIKTHLVAEQKRADMEQFILQRIQQKGERIFWIVPRIESVEDDANELADIESRFTQLTTGPFRGISAAVVHGGMGSAEKEEAMSRFASGDISLLIATTVIEVGINVPEATVMVIENSERFGLAQLHQLRGRVGRGNLDSWAFLLGSSSLSEESVERLQQFTNAADGFEIAELDLRLRGTGQVAGFRQSGFSELQFCNILDDADMFQQAVEDIDTILAR